MMPVLATGATHKEYSSELDPQNYSKMEPFLGAGAPAKPSKRLQRGIKILVLTPLKKAPKTDPQKKHHKNQQKRSIWRLWRPNAPQSAPRGSPKGCPNPHKIDTKSSLSHHGRPPGTFNLKKWSQRGVSPQNILKIGRTNNKLTRFFRQSMGTRSHSKTQQKKMAGAPPCISCFGGSVSAGRVVAS